MKKLLVSTAICSSVAFAAMPGVAAAQEDAAAGAGIGEIIVTAQKRAENIQDVPIAISAVSGEFLESRGITSIDSLGSIAPNVKIERAPSNKTISQISIRGSVTINPAITWEPAVGLYLDGVYIAKAQGSIFDVADLERVEILRGPQGTLYGRNALAGAVNLVTKKPSGELGGSAEISYGNFDAWKGKAVLDLPAFGPFSVKLSGQIQKRDGYIKLTDNPHPVEGFLASSPLEGRTNDLDSKSAMVQVRFEPTDNVTIDYAYDYSKFDQRPDYAQLVNAMDFPMVPLSLYVKRDRQSKASLDNQPLYERSRSYGHALTAALELGDITLKSISSYRNLKWNDRLDLDGTPLDVAYTGRDTKFHSYSQELQATGTVWDDRVNFVVGAFYYKEKAETRGPQRYFGAYGPGAMQVFQSDYGSHTKAWALYAQTDIKITEPLKLTLGARYTEEKKDIMRFVASGDNMTDPLVTGVDLGYGDVPDAKYSNFSPAATLSYEFSRNVNVYARFARGFKSGGFNGETNDFRAPTADCPSGAYELCNPYRPEKVDSYEIGVKTRLAGGKVIFNVAAFWDEHKDIQLSVFTASGTAGSIVRNAAKARIRGIEVETVIRPVDALTINASFAYLDAKYKSYIEAIGGVDTDVSGNRAFPHTPKYTASVGADLRVAEGDWGKFNINGDLSYVSSYYTYPYALVPEFVGQQDAHNTRSKGRTIVNMRANVAAIPLSGGVQGEVSLWVRNLTKEDNPSNFIDFGSGFGGLTVGYFPDPRTYGITAGIKF